ncbi:MAG: hypothetical protein A2Y28_00500 [Chlamydiae bacterium GWC2_50_10]|nr:MAG: hypothetical protein A2Y28_00500 [Chlamydiae bacterium GWC2_50_10]OGN54832.1 MAG: hypothetical protein A2098_00610 [Chlamydiae bacterium GWF2_49_8]OGN57823.1 MAG: hypothetical protein A3D18_00495 [Chlamydiae bacterium RIFCSPHIGHO2_02_FULL_49_29]OGN62747.1 MAG: hypothetical protein A3E26_00070 [Chlamydiae bacterium RIFCSPHIGHO2_12_FULL_49_32]OGN67909.1 MAG: hypothetical protein A3I15_04635 [Chlamydiae bacterium RIFCSPLOWO2_02_FULL_49_12]OGN73531.1 MAG: hypothetical protein A3G30_04855 [
MPTYSYQCQECRHSFDAFQKIVDQPLVECPLCKKKSLQRGIGGGLATFQFCGSGFYVNDYKKKPASQEAKKEECGCNKKKCCRAKDEK